VRRGGKPLDLAELVMHAGPKSVAIVGTAKNVGKTVTMNYLSSGLSERGLVVGLVSSGRDGETTDSFTGEPKPSVIPPEGTWIATAEGALAGLGGSLEIADVSERTGLLGRLVLGRLRESTPVELVGPQNVKELASVVERMHAFGAQVVLVDGALDRVAAASPFVTDAVILSTGAEAGADLSVVAGTAASIVGLWSLKTPNDPEVLALASKAIDEGCVAFLERFTPTVEATVEAPGDPPSCWTLRRTAFSTVLGREEEVLGEAGVASYVVVPGAVSERFLSEAEGWPERDAIAEGWPHRDALAVIARDSTALFVRPGSPVPVYVSREMRLLAITVNPVSERGVSYEPREMVDQVYREVFRKTGKRIPVFDIVSGEKSGREVREVAVG
jgi:hypothetical protein